MLKKIVAGSLVAALAAGFIFGRDMFSYARTFGSNVRHAVRSEITPEFEIDRIRTEVDQLMPEIRRHMTVVAEQSVDVKDQERAIAAKESNLSKQKDEILALRADLDSGRDRFVYSKVSYSRGEVQNDLAERFESFRNTEDAVNRDRKILVAVKETLRANQKKLNVMLERKQDLIVQVSQLEARLKQIQATEAINSIEVDDSQLSHVEQMIKNMNHALDVRESLLDTQGHALGRIPVTEEVCDDNGDVVSEIDRHFGLVSEDEFVAEADTAPSI